MGVHSTTLSILTLKEALAKQVILPVPGSVFTPCWHVDGKVDMHAVVVACADVAHERGVACVGWGYDPIIGCYFAKYMRPILAA